MDLGEELKLREGKGGNKEIFDGNKTCTLVLYALICTVLYATLETRTVHDQLDSI